MKESEVYYPFNEAEADAANREWGFNCGPAALAFALRVKPEAVRHAIPMFESKGYTSPSMMKAALANLKASVKMGLAGSLACKLNMFDEQIALVRIQWTGPRTEPGANGKWAYTHTHWIATWRTRLDNTPLGSVLCPPTLFDVNGGIQRFTEWENKIVPAITKTIKSADGGYFPTHIWRL